MMMKIGNCQNIRADLPQKDRQMAYWVFESIANIDLTAKTMKDVIDDVTQDSQYPPYLLVLTCPMGALVKFPPRLTKGICNSWSLQRRNFPFHVEK
jgi:hypothetical protein